MSEVALAFHEEPDRKTRDVTPKSSRRPATPGKRRAVRRKASRGAHATSPESARPARSRAKETATPPSALRYESLAVRYIKNSLPSNPQDLTRYIIISSHHLRAKMEQLKALARIEMGSKMYWQTLAEGQVCGERFLFALELLGNILEEAELSKGGRPSKTSPSQGRVLTLEQMGIPRQLSSDCQRIARHPFELRTTIIDARRKGDIPTKLSLLWLIGLQERFQPVPFPPLPDDLFDAILGDPAWPYDFATRGRSIERHYPTVLSDRMKGSG